METRRRRAAEEEARALRAEVERWVLDGEAGQAASEALRDLFRDGLESAVHRALADGELARTLAGSLRGELAGTFETEIREEVAKQVRQALSDSLFSSEELEELRQEVRQAVVTAVTAAEQPRPGRRPAAARQPPTATAASGPGGGGRLPGGGNDPGSVSGSGPIPPARSTYGRKPTFGALDWSRPALLASLALGLVLAFAALWFFFLRGQEPAATAGTVTSPPATTTVDPDAGGSSEAGATPRTVPDAPAAAGDTRLYALWRARVANDYSAPSNLPTPVAERFACWFGGVTEVDLAEAVQEAEAAAGSTALENRLRIAFQPCIGEDRVGPGANTAVFAAQAAAHRALERRASRDWAGCRKSPGTPPTLAGFRADGLHGPGTYALLDTLAACRGVDAAVSFDGTSDTTDYLFALYLALVDLEGVA